MATTARRLLTNVSKGELSPLIEGRPDLAAYFEGAATLENWLILRQGGITRRPGLRFIAEVKDSSKDTILLPFEASVNDTYIAEVGNLYTRFCKHTKQQILNGGVPVEVAAPWTESQVRRIHYTQSVDVLFGFHPDAQQHRLVRISDTNWAIQSIVYSPPPTFENDTDLSGGTITLTPANTAGNDIVFTASAAVFLAADVGRQIIFGASRAIITAFGSSAGDVASPNDQVRADIIDAFPNTNPIPAGSWFIRRSPQTTLDSNKKGPKGTIATLVAGANAFRAADVGKYIHILGGIIRITAFTSVTTVKGEIVSVLSLSELADPGAVGAGSWSLEVPSWSSILGFPGTGEFFQGRLGQAGTHAQKTTFWLSASDNFDDYGIGATADRAIDYTVASRGLDRINWMADNIDLFMGSGGVEIQARGGRDDAPMGGDQVPLVTKITTHGSAEIQPIIISRRIVFVERSNREILSIAFSIEEDGPDVLELTAAAEHVTAPGIRLGPVAFQKRLHPRMYYVREDGQLIVLTYFHHEKVIGFSRCVTDGTFEAVAAISAPGAANDQVWCIVKRTINGQIKRYIELFDEEADEVEGRLWTSLQTDCAKVYDLAGVPTNEFTGLGHIEGKLADVIIDGSYRGTFTVTAGKVTIPVAEAGTQHAEIGLHYDSTFRTMRPAIEGSMVEGLVRSWKKIWMRVKDSIGGKINGEEIQYGQSPLGSLMLHTGDVDVSNDGSDTDGRITIVQDKPYPMTILAVFGEIIFSDEG